jgi:hypothetical protein
MSSNDNMLTTVTPTSEIKNKGFILLDSLFKENGWHMTKNEMNLIEYTKQGHESDFFQIKLDQKNVYISVPIKNSPYQYKTTFTNYFDASEYVEKRFKDYTL